MSRFTALLESSQCCHSPSRGAPFCARRHEKILKVNCTLTTSLWEARSLRRRPGRARPLRSAELMSTAQQAERSTEKVNVLFVCLGNICRSPTAEAVFRAVVEKAAVQDRFVIDSCGTGGGNPDWYKDKGWAYHEGDPSDQRMLAAAAKRGVCLTSRSRPLTPEDMAIFDFILGMDFENTATIQVAADYWLARGKPIPPKYREKVQLMCRYLDPNGRFRGITEVPDPYYGGAKGFELVLDLLEDACEGLLQHIKEHNFSTAEAV